MAPSRRTRRNLSPVAVAVSGVWATWAALAVFVSAVDPYDLHPWGARTGIPGAFQPFVGERYLAMAIKDPNADLVLIGSSPTTPYAPDDLRLAYPDARKPWNVSLHGGLGVDRMAIMDAFARDSAAKRYLITVDVFLAARNQEARPGFPFFAYDRAFWNDLRIVTPQALADSLTVLRFGSPEPDPAATLREERELNVSTAKLWRTPENRLRLVQAVSQGREAITGGDRTACSDFPAVTEFMRSVGRLRATGARVDLLIPTYSSALWFGWARDAERRREFGTHLLSDQLAMRRCVVLAASSMGVSVHAQDATSPALNDLRNFRDPGHIHGRANLMAFISMPNDPATRLTPENFDGYAQGVRAAARTFDPNAPW